MCVCLFVCLFVVVFLLLLFFFVFFLCVCVIFVFLFVCFLFFVFFLGGLPAELHEEGRTLLDLCCNVRANASKPRESEHSQPQ